MEAAFFDLDKTVIAKSSLLAFGWRRLRNRQPGNGLVLSSRA